MADPLKKSDVTPIPKKKYELKSVFFVEGSGCLSESLNIKLTKSYILLSRWPPLLQVSISSSISW